MEYCPELWVVSVVKSTYAALCHGIDEAYKQSTENHEPKSDGSEHIGILRSGVWGDKTRCGVSCDSGIRLRRVLDEALFRTLDS